MRLEQSFEVPVPVAQAWAVLLDVERIAPCMPGATLTGVEGESFTGHVRVNLGPVSLAYKGTGRFTEKDEAGRRLSLIAQGQDSRGGGGAQARITAVLHTANGGASTLVKVVADVDIAGKAAQFGRGMIADVSNKLVKQFADCLAQTIAAEPVPAAAPAAAAPPPASSVPAAVPAAVPAMAPAMAPAPVVVDAVAAPSPPPLAPVFTEPTPAPEPVAEHVIPKPFEPVTPPFEPSAAPDPFVPSTEPFAPEPGAGEPPAVAVAPAAVEPEPLTVPEPVAYEPPPVVAPEPVATEPELVAEPVAYEPPPVAAPASAAVEPEPVAYEPVAEPVAAPAPVAVEPEPVPPTFTPLPAPEPVAAEPTLAAPGYTAPPATNTNPPEYHPLALQEPATDAPAATPVVPVTAGFPEPEAAAKSAAEYAYTPEPLATPAGAPAARPAPKEAEPIDLLAVSGAKGILRRAAPVLIIVALALVGLIVWLVVA